MKIKTYTLIIALLSFSANVFSHPGHDHNLFISSVIHGGIFFALVAAISTGIWMLRPSQKTLKKSVNQVRK